MTAEESTVAREALVRERTAAVGALDALGVPDAVEHVEQEPVEDRTVAPGAQQQHPAARGDRCVFGARRVDGRHGRGVRLHSTTDRPTAVSTVQPAHPALCRRVRYTCTAQLDNDKMTKKLYRAQAVTKSLARYGIAVQVNNVQTGNF